MTTDSFGLLPTRQPEHEDDLAAAGDDRRAAQKVEDER